jgi:Uma2 family endonuclease
MSPHGAPHAGAIHRLTDILVPAVKGRATCRIQLPLALGDTSEPEPDVAVVALGSYHRAHPTAAFLVVEVSDSSMAYDRRTKGVLYAAHSIPEYWIVDTTHQRIEVHTEIVDGAYTRVTPHALGETIRSTALPGLAVAVSDVFA